MKKALSFLILLILISCGHLGNDKKEKIISVSIGPFKYFIEQISGNDFYVNVMVPAGADPHVYEPYPLQVNNLRKSIGYISDGFLGFEMSWLDRFYETNRTIKKLSLSDNIIPLVDLHNEDGKRSEGSDPHFWVSPKCALSMAESIYVFLCQLNPSKKDTYTDNYNKLVLKIKEMDSKASELFSSLKGKSFMIYHPNLAYLARDYGLREISVEFEGKEPSPSRLRELIDVARQDDIKTIFVQKEFDTKNARAIADEIDAMIVIIDPLSDDWYSSTMDIIDKLSDALNKNK
jgi:zinc transport system substrate-binding protein